MASIVGDDELRHFVHAHADGDRAAAWVASRQLSVITTSQLRLAGLERGAIAHRRSRGVLLGLFRGVYVWGSGPPVPGARELAAHLLCGERAYVSHRSAAALWRMLPPAGDHVEVTAAGTHRRSRPGLDVHRVGSLTAPDTSLRYGIPVTSPARTWIDLASTATADELDRALSEAYVLGLFSERQVHAALERSTGRTGAPRCRRLLRRLEGPAISRSEAERILRRLIHEAGLPRPATNVMVCGYEADLFWPAQRLIVEFDGFAAHGNRAAFERDRARDAALVAAGYRVIRVTWRQLAEAPLRVIANLARALACGL